MGLKFLKRRARKETTDIHNTFKASTKGSEGSRSNTTLHTVRCDDSSTVSERSFSSKASILESLARNGKWEAVLQLVQESHLDDWTSNHTKPSGTKEEEEVSCDYSLYQCTTPLHLVLAQQAPLHIVERMITLIHEHLQVPVPEESPDEEGRTPLHIAVTSGCKEEVAARLLSGSSLVMPAVLVDAQGQTPLHAACAAQIVKTKKKNVFKANPVAMQKWNKRCVLLLLMEEYPEACAVRDKAGKTPADYLRETGTIVDSTLASLQRLQDEYAVTANEVMQVPTEMCPTLRYADIPLVVPSTEPSCRDFDYVVSLSDTALLSDAAADDVPTSPSDVSTIGDAEAELLGMESWGA